MEELITVRDLARQFKLRPEIIRRKVRNKQIKAYKIGKEWRFSKNDVINFLNNCLQ